MNWKIRLNKIPTWCMGKEKDGKWRRGKRKQKRICLIEKEKVEKGRGKKEE